MKGAHVLVVEDDDAVRLTTSLVLERQGFTVTAARDGVEALELVESMPFDIAVVDVMMPRMDGITLVRRIQPYALPSVMLTARDLPHDQVVGLEAGADDYIVKPFDGDVLAARLRAVLRRHRAVDTDQTVAVGALRVDLAGMTATLAGVPLHLSGTEFRLLAVFVEHAGKVLSKRQLLEQVWGDTGWGDDHVVEVNVARLRGKIGAARLKTVRGLGYQLIAE